MNDVDFYLGAMRKRGDEWCEVANVLASMISDERAEWQDRVKAATEVADTFKKTLDHVLDLIAWRANTNNERKDNKQ